jgi:glycosyltransferase involved in cell wall biosynthesis
LAASVHRQQPGRPIYFLWVGGQLDGPEFGLLWHDATKLRVGPYLRFLGVQSNPFDYFSAFDVFALVSREDPFPLVMLECASLAKPLLCFESSGGASEFVDKSCGFVMPYLDVDEMARCIFQLHESPELRSGLGKSAAEKVRSKHDVDISAPRILDIIELMSSPSSAHAKSSR